MSTTESQNASASGLCVQVHAVYLFFRVFSFSSDAGTLSSSKMSKSVGDLRHRVNKLHFCDYCGNGNIVCFFVHSSVNSSFTL